MAAAVQDSPGMTPTAADRLTNPRACPRLPIIPAIPRKLERKLHNSSSMVAGSKSARNAIPGMPASRPIVGTDGHLQNSHSGKTQQDPETSTSNHKLQPMESSIESVPTEKDLGSQEAAAPSMESSLNRAVSTIDNDRDIGSIWESKNPANEDSLKVREEDAVGIFPRAERAVKTPSLKAEQAPSPDPSVTTTSPAAHSVLDPQSPSFVPEASRTPQNPAETGSNTSNEVDVSTQQSDPHVPYPLQTTASWMSYQTPPDGSVNSSAQRPKYGHGHTTSLFYDPAAPYNHPNVDPAVYYGYGHSHNLSFYPQSSQSYASASPAQSTYEGYAIATNPYVSHPRLDAPSHRHAPSTNIGTATPFPNHSDYLSYQSSGQYPPSIPQFGSQFPITPSATPPNPGSQKPARCQTNDSGQYTPADQQVPVDSHDRKKVLEEISQDYKDWCNRTTGALKEETEAVAYPTALSNHIIENFNNPTFADCELYLSHVNHRFEPAVVSLHSVLIAQNPKLLELVHSAEVREDGKKQILLAVDDRYTAPAALKTAIKICYGERPSQYTGYPGELASELEISTAWMDNALALAAAGHLLGMTGVAHRGEQIASIILDWNNLIQALSFAMDPTVQRAWGSSNGSSGFPCNASELLLSCLYFVVSNIPVDVILDSAAERLPSIDRLPAVPSIQSSTSRARLSQIRFGDLQVKAEETPSEHDILISRILVSLPFVHFKFILDRMPVPINRKIAKTVIEERERRRLSALDASASAVQISPEHDLVLRQAERSVHEEVGETGRVGIEVLGM
ncbi:MAG: hypothetical protein Q9184_004536 [Pyrenodesmia sp. 2 TL-2023]